MSIEDPRISATASENVSHDFRQDIHEDASIETSARQGVEVAQADNNQQPEKTDRVPAAPQTAAASAHPAEIVPDQNNVAHLPADVSIDDIRVEGNNLVLIQADGTEIVIVNGAVHVPTFLLGEVELPQQAVIAALEQNNINVAAGPDGSYSAHSGSPSSGGNFDTIQQPPHLPPLIADLLQNTDQPDGQPGRLFGGVGRHGQDATPPTSPAVPDGSPTVSLHVINLGNLATTLVLDESAGIQTSPDNDTALSDIADLFKGVSNQGFDGHMNGAQYATAGLLQADIQFGINGPAATNAVQWSLELGSGNNHESGLKTTGGHEIYFFEENGLIVGRYDAENGEVTSADPAAFALAIDPVTGQLSMVQYVSIYNTDSNSQDEIDFIKSGQVLAKVTVSDFDGDKVDATVDIGDKIGFSDDGPILISVPAPAGDYSGSFFFDGFTSNGNAWNEKSGVNNTGVSGNWHIAWADGSEGTPQLERVGDGYLGMHSSTNGYMIDLDASPGDVAVSQVLKLAEGESYTLTFEAGAAQAGSKHLVVTFGGVVVLEIDPPGQMTTYSISIVGGAGNASNTLEFKETGHADYYGTFLANVSVTGNSAILDDEDVGKAGNQGGTGDDGHGATAFGTIDFDAGSDGLGHIQVTGLESVAGLGNAALSVMYIDDTGKGTAEALGEGVWTPNGQGGSMSWSSLHVQNAIVVTVNADGTYSVTLNAALAHPATGTEDNLVLNFGFDIYDGDGDHVSGTISVNVDDDSPSVNQQALQSATVAEDDIKTSLSQGTSPNDGNADGSYTGNASNSLPGPATVSGSIANVVNFGSDGKGGFSFTGDVSSLGALSSHGDALSYTVANGVLTATAGEGEGARVIFTLTLSNDGDYTFKLFDQLDHGTDATNGSVPIDFGGLIQATDGDGDSIPLTGGLKIAITDDSPTTAGRAHVSGTVEEEQLNGNEDTSGGSGSATDDDISHHGHFHDNTTAVVSGSGANSLATLVNTGADEGGHFSLNSELVGNAIKADGGASVKSGGSLVSVTSVAEGADANGHYQTITAGTTGEGAHAVFTLTVYDNGSWKFELKDNLDHSYGNNGEGVLKLDLSSLVQYTDFDNDTVTLDAKSFLVSVIDDVPVAAISASASKAPSLETQDHDTIGSGVGGTDTASADFSGAFKITSSYGADGAGTTNTTYALSLSGNSHHDDHDDWDRGGFGDRVDSGLESNDHAIYLYEINGVIVGSTASSSHSVGQGNIIFTISVDGTGKVTLTQYDAIDHVGNGNGSVISLDEGLVRLTATVTITDHDGDKATDSASIDLGCNIKFDDDTPSITLTAGSDAALTLTTQDADTIGNNFDTVSRSFAGVFTAVSSYGADGAGNTVTSYALSVSAQGGLSGLSHDDQAIHLFVKNGIVYGSTAGSANDINVGNTVFKIEVSSGGTVTLTQYSAIDHLGEGNNTSIALANDLVKLTATATITDDDGDQRSSSASIDLGGNIKFDDHTPSITLTAGSDAALTLTTRDADTIGANYDTASRNFAGVFHAVSSYGADGMGSTVTSYALSVTGQPDSQNHVDSKLDSHGQTIYLYKIGDTVYGSTASTSDKVGQTNTIFKITVDNAGEVTLTQYDAIDHGGNGTVVSLADNLVKLTGTATITDGDNDRKSSSATVDLGGNIRFDDHTPSITLTASGEANVVLATQDADTIGANCDTASQSFAGVFNAVSSYGADGAGDLATSYALSVTQGGTSGLKSDNQTIYLYQSNGVIYGSTASTFQGVGQTNTIFKVTVDGTGKVTLTQYEAIDHGGDGTVVSLADNLLKLTATATITDYDGDSRSSSATIEIGRNITFADDGPKLIANATVTAKVDEDGLTWANADANRTGENADTDTSTPSNGLTATGSLSTLVDFGADGPGANGGFTLKSVNGTALAGITSAGQQVHIVTNGSTLTGYVEVGGGSGYDAAHEKAIFTLVLGADGKYTFTLIEQLDHPAGSGENTLTFDLSSYVTATDGDGDYVDLGAGSLKVSVLDDIPVISARASNDTTTQVQTDTETRTWTTTEMVQETFTLKAGNQSERWLGSADGHHDLLLTARSGNSSASVNTSSGTIGVSNQWIDSSSEVLSMNFVTNVGANNQAADPHSSAQFKVDVSGNGGSAAVFIDATNGGSFVELTFMINGQAVTAKAAYQGNTQIGYVLSSVPDGAVISVTAANTNGAFDVLKVSNYNGVNYDSRHEYDGDKFRISDIQTSVPTQVTHTEQVPVYTTITNHETLLIAHDESHGVNTLADPNAAADTANTPPAAIYMANALGYASSATSVLTGANALFIGSVGSDKSVTWSFSVTKADGSAFNGTDSGLMTNDNKHILLKTGTDGTLIGYTVNGQSTIEVFKVYVDADGHVWIAQYQPIHNNEAGSSPAAYDDIVKVVVDGGLHIQATLTDADGDKTSAVSQVYLTVQFQDDGPVAHNMVAQPVAEGSVVEGKLDFAQGTDGATVSKINGVSLTFGNDGWSQGIPTTQGALRVTADGNYQFIAHSDNVYKDAGSADFSFTVKDNDGDTSTANVSFNVSDDTDVVKVVLTALPSSTGEDGGSITYTASLVDANGQAVTTHNALTVTLANNQVITIAAGSSSGDSDPVAVNRDDVYREVDSVSNHIVTVVEANAGTTGAFENLQADTTPVTTTITDDTDVVKVVLTALPSSTGEDGGSITYTASLVDANGQAVTTHNALTVTLANNQVITIAAGSSSGDSDPVAVNRDDVYREVDSVSNHIVTVVEANAGTAGAFENLQADTTPVTTTITDDTDVVTATLTATSAAHAGGGTDVIYMITLSTTSGLSSIAPQSGQPLTFTLANSDASGQPITVTVPAGSSSGFVTVTYPATTTSISNSIAGSVANSAQYEQLSTSGTVSLNLNSLPIGGGSISLTLSEAALDTVLNGSSGGVPADLVAGAVTGSAPDSRDETAQATTGITFTATGETITIGFDNPTGSGWTAPTVSGLASGYTVSWALNGGQLVGNLISPTHTDLGIFVRLALTGNTSAPAGQSATPTVTATLVDNLIDGPGVYQVTIGGIKVTATDATGDKVSGSVNLTITDDTPVAHSVTESAVTGSMSTVNVQLIVDVSYSMYSSYGGGVSNVPGGYTQDRIGLARYSMEQLLESNDQIKYVEIVKFGESASGTVWMTKADALAYIQNNANWSGSGGTNYDLGLQQAMSSYGTGAPVQADKNVVYFLSDGAPSGDGIASGADDGNHTNNSVTTGEWEAFITAKGIDSVYAIGIGGSINVSNLEPVSYPNTDGSDSNTTEDTVILVGTSDVTGLLATLQDFLGNAQSVGGNVVIDGGVDASFGADGGHVQSIVVNGVTYTFTPGAIAGTGTVSESGTPAGAYQDHGTWIEIKTALGGTLTFYFTDVGTTHHAGDYSYLAPISNTGNESFAYTFVDGDGDTAGATLAISVTAPPNANPVITAPNNGTDSTNLSIAESTTAVTDVNATDADGNTLVYSIVETAGTDYAKFAINSSTGVLTFISAPNYEAPGDVGGTAGDNVYVVTFQVSDGHGGVDTQTLNVTVTNVNDAPVGFGDNIYTNSSSQGQGTTLTVQNAWLVANDTDADGNTLNVGTAADGTDVDNVTRGSSSTSIRVDITSGNSGNFTYTATDGIANSTSTTVNVYRGSSDSVITGGAGNDILIGSGSTAATLDGGAGRDFVTGGSGNDTIVADQNDYLIDGGLGTDTLRVDANFTSANNNQIVNIENVTINSSATVLLDLSNQSEDFAKITAGTGVNTIKAGSGDDVIAFGATLTGADTVDGGAGSDTLTFADSNGATNDLDKVTNIETITLGAATTNVTTVDALVAAGATLTVNGSALSSGQSLTWNGAAETDGSFNITGGAGSDTITGGARDDIITSGAGNDTLAGGDGNDKFVLAGNLTNADTINGGAGNDTLTFTDSNGATNDLDKVTNIETITLGAATTNVTTVDTLVASGATLKVDGSALTSSQTLTWNGAAETNGAFNITGGAGNDSITGGSGADRINGGAGGDTLYGGGGKDTFVIVAGESTPTIGGSGNSGTISGHDIVMDWGIGGVADKIAFSVAPVRATTGYVDGAGDSTLTINQSSSNRTVESHSVDAATGMATFYDTDGGATALTITSTARAAAAVQYLMGSDIGNAGATLAFTDGTNTYIYQQTGDAAGGTLVQLSNTLLTSIYNGSVVASSIDPIILDLDHNGIALTSLDNGVQFDINADGHKDQIAWTSASDGILAFDVDGNGKIDNGSEIFSPHFAGGSYVDGLAALATLDSNHDGKIDATDEAFSKLTVWQDLNHNGITDSGELSSLADHSISGISLDASTSGTEINGQSILADGSYTLTDGSTGHFVEVAFDTTLGGSENGGNAYSLIGSDGDDILSGSAGGYTMTGGAGADTFVLDTDALKGVSMADVITDYKASEGDTLDVSKLLDSLLGHQASEAEALASVKTTVSGTDTVVSVNANGGWHDVAVLQNTTEAVKILFDDKHDTTTAPHVG
ncbi:DUF5801 repeats-in-toxin domain-containing protein [Rhizobium sp. RHZ01]|uniref:DUF5801 repeats-in-toxin domain-containing protein n=1 Tax=Rhizobium sp. RHZ01 TaxID=2769304 RepID=UPI0017821422|nr:DUF5801 repeats-in-toxin domain-containing protein [Rhizobium sp. RHZ01]MBD9446917.1 type I secretion C-terminal target domain-containing protein [Rhizobium sp. RHZ01]